MIKAVIFDMDGTMIDSEKVFTDCWKPVLNKLGLEYPEGIAEATRGSAGESLFSIMRSYLGQDCDVQAVCKEISIYADAIFEKGVDKKKGLDNILKFCKENNIKMAVASSSRMEHITRNLINTNTQEYFNVIASGEFIKNNKPAPDIFLEAAKQLDVSSTECIVLEDSFNGIRAGRNGNFITYMIPDLSLPNEEMISLADGIFNDFDEVIEQIKLLLKGE